MISSIVMTSAKRRCMVSSASSCRLASSSATASPTTNALKLRWKASRTVDSTQQLVESTVRDAFQRNFKAFVVGDAVAELDARRHELALETMHLLFAEVITIDEIIGLWAAAAGR